MARVIASASPIRRDAERLEALRASVAAILSDIEALQAMPEAERVAALPEEDELRRKLNTLTA